MPNSPESPNIQNSRWNSSNSDDGNRFNSPDSFAFSPRTDTTLSTDSRSSKSPLHNSTNEFRKSQQDSILKSWFRKVFAMTCSFLFLSVLMIIAIFDWLFCKNTPSDKHTGNLSSDIKTKFNIPLSQTERKLIPDLQYYFRLCDLELVEYKITTSDGFVLTMERLIDPTKMVNVNNYKPPVILLHGLLQSTASFCTSGKNSIAYYLFQQGFDVWLGNNRCGFNPQHERYSTKDFGMWNWDMFDMALNDLPTMINHVLNHSNFKKVTYIGHSQGTTQMFLLLSDRFGLSNINSKINLFISLSPAVYGGPLLNKNFIRFVQSLSENSYYWFFGNLSFMPIMNFMRVSVMPEKIYGFFGFIMFRYLFGWNDKLWDPRLRNRHFLFSPTFMSSKSMNWWMGRNGFAKNGCIFPNFKIHDDTNNNNNNNNNNKNNNNNNDDSNQLRHEQWYSRPDLPRFSLYVPLNDELVDGIRLEQHIYNHEPILSKNFSLTKIPGYSHLDVLWAADVIEKVAIPVVKDIKEAFEDEINELNNSSNSSNSNPQQASRFKTRF